MLTESELLQSIHQSTNMGREGIQSVLNYAKDDRLRQALEQQLVEYEKLAGASGKMLLERDEKPKETNPVAKASSAAMSAMKLMADPSASKIAEMMIQGSTMGIIEETESLKKHPEADEPIQQIARDMIQFEQDSIERLKQYL